MMKILKYVLLDLLRNKIVIGYTLILLAISLSVFSIENNAAKGLVSLLNIILIILPLINIIFSAIYTYNSTEFIELLVSQPLPRGEIWYSLYAGLAGSLSLAFVLGVGIPVVIYAPTVTGFTMRAMGIALTCIFVAVALLTAVYTRDKAKGIGVAIILWLFFGLIYDALVLLALFQFSDYPMEIPMVVLSMLNPVDMARVLILIQMDVSALMGYTGAVFKNFFGTGPGIIASGAALLAWVVVPMLLSQRFFQRKDL